MLSKCPKCGQEYELFEERQGKVLGWLCAVCWNEECFTSKEEKEDA